MKKNRLLAFILLSIGLPTFSIVAVDTSTGEIGSAGASCIANSIIISDIYPGVGAIHTQSYWNSTNQQNAGMLMEQGYSPEYIINYLINNDVSNNPGIRQYGAVDLVGVGRSASFTGSDCIDYRGHITGDGYAIQGNILLGPEILEMMESNFLSSEGSLAERLMYSMQGANVPGADTRCLDDGVSSLSSFIRVASMDDLYDDYFLDINVASVPQAYIDPLDSLQTVFDSWLLDNTEFTPGDLNNDYIIDILDIIITINIIFGNISPMLWQELAADMDANGIVNIVDIIQIINIIV